LRWPGSVEQPLSFVDLGPAAISLSQLLIQEALFQFLHFSNYIVWHMAAGGSRRYQPTVQTNLCVALALATRKNGFDELLHPPVM
jgi:hypothetical protein